MNFPINNSFNSSFIAPTQQNGTRKINDYLTVGYVNAGLHENNDDGECDIINIKNEDKNDKSPMALAFPSFFLKKLYSTGQVEVNCLQNTMVIAKNIIKAEYRMEHFKYLLDNLENNVTKIEERCLENNLRTKLAKIELENYEKAKKTFIAKHGELLKNETPNLNELYNDLERLDRSRHRLLKLLDQL